jgi:diketogulonate reductase-like aldo/keto reductase
MNRSLLALIAYSFVGSDHPLAMLNNVAHWLQNLAIVERIKALAEKKGCLPGQLALAWVHAQVCCARDLSSTQASSRTHTSYHMVLITQC